MSVTVVSFASPPCPVRFLAVDELHLWLADLNVPDEQFALIKQPLSAEERERADRFRFEHDRRHYTVARGVLRMLLGHYTNTSPESVRFTYNAHGKPALADSQLCRFNVSHSHGWAIYGFAVDREIGVDIERIRPDLAGMDIAERFFSPTEVAALGRVPDADRTKAFFNCWTRKEAFIKAKGLGVFLGLHTFAVTLAPGEEPALLSHDADPDAAERWMMFELQAPDGFVGAAAVEDGEITPRYWKWDPGSFQKL